MTIKDGEIIEAADHEKNIVSFLEGLYQSVKLSAAAAITAMDHLFAEADSFSDSNGYKNTISTGDTTAFYGEFGEEYYIGKVAGSVENDTKTNANASTTGSITTSGTIAVAGYFSSVFTNASTLGSSPTVTINKNGSPIAQKAVPGGSFQNVSFSKSDYSEFFEAGDSFSIVVTGSGSAFYYASGKSFSGTNFSYSSQTEAGTSGSSQTVFGYSPVPISDAVVETNSKTFPQNIASILVVADSVTPGDSSVTVDVSTDGGSSFEKTGQALNQVIELDGDNTDVVLKFNLNVDGTDTPKLYGYAFQVWP